ncbi:FAS1 domain-containing protein, partial [Terfezia boudieri ATCC MYA-4762]
PHKRPDHPHEPHKRPGNPDEPHKRPPIYTNKTIYELLSESKYTTKAFSIIKDDEELSEFFKNTKANMTVFVPTDKAFESLPPHHPPHNATDALSKEFLRKAVLYHTSPDPYDTRKLFFSKTIPSSLKSEGGIGKGNYQRLRISHQPFFGLRVNMLSKIIAGNIYATNGIIHGIDHLIILPPYAQQLVGILPTVFSTSALALAKMELAGEPKLPEGPKTFFIPPNSAWRGLGYRVNAFLFSRFGEKHLAALMKYHITHGKVVYTDYVIEPPKDGDEAKIEDEGHYHTELDTFLGDAKLTVDIWRKGPWAKLVVGDKVPTMLTDIITRDGVLHVPVRVLIPPRPKPD